MSDVQPEDVVLGSVNDDGALMRTSSVAFTLTYDDWVLANFDEGDDSSPTADIDGDGLDNLLEYAVGSCLLYTSPSPRDQRGSRMPSSA